jgi:hypothetical protein
VCRHGTGLQFTRLALPALVPRFQLASRMSRWSTDKSGEVPRPTAVEVHHLERRIGTFNVRSIDDVPPATVRAAYPTINKKASVTSAPSSSHRLFGRPVGMRSRSFAKKSVSRTAGVIVRGQLVTRGIAKRADNRFDSVRSTYLL